MSENAEKKSVLQRAIDAGVTERTADLEGRLKAAEKAIAALQRGADGAEGVGAKDLERLLTQWAEENMPEYVNRALLQQLAVPAARRRVRSAGVAGEPDGCRHKNSLKKCASCRAKKVAAATGG